jgi:hypothetical protein
MISNDRLNELALIFSAAGVMALHWCETEACACSGCVNVGMTYIFKKHNITPPTHEEWLEVINHLLLKELDNTFFDLISISQVEENYTGFKKFLFWRKRAKLDSDRIEKLLYS